MVVLGSITFYLRYYQILIGIPYIHTKYLKENYIGDHLLCIYPRHTGTYLSDKANQQ